MSRRALPPRVARQMRIQAEATAAGVRARRAGRAGSRIVVGPWLAEVGFELLYWIPFVQHVLAARGIDPARVVVLSRGGVGSWYGRACGQYVDLHDLFDAGELLRMQRERIRVAGDQKHVDVTALDREALRRLREHLGGEEVAVLHPSVMFRRFRPIWMRRRTMRAAHRELRFEPGTRLPATLDLPDDYWAVKLYTSDCLPHSDATLDRLRTTLSVFARKRPLVLLRVGRKLDDHMDMALANVDGVQVMARSDTLADNLLQQTEVIQRSSRLVSTYGGFSYLGVLSEVPTTSIYEFGNFNPQHLEVLRTGRQQLGLGPAVDLSLVQLSALAGG